MKLINIIEDTEFSEGRSRKELGSGVDHVVFTATDETDVVYKLGPKLVIDSWFEDFKKNPDIFPKIYKRGRTSLKLKSPKSIPTSKGWKTFPVGTKLPLDYVKMEKLNTDKVQQEWDMLDKISEDIREIDGYTFYDFLIVYMTWRPENKVRGWNDDSTINMFDSEMKKRGVQIYKLFKRYVDLTDKVKKITNTIPDLHRYNFGYDSEGRLKCLDP